MLQAARCSAKEAPPQVQDMLMPPATSTIFPSQAACVAACAQGPAMAAAMSMASPLTVKEPELPGMHWPLVPAALGARSCAKEAPPQVQDMLMPPATSTIFPSQAACVAACAQGPAMAAAMSMASPLTVKEPELP